MTAYCFGWAQNMQKEEKKKGKGAVLCLSLRLNLIYADRSITSSCLFTAMDISILIHHVGDPKHDETSSPVSNHFLNTKRKIFIIHKHRQSWRTLTSMNRKSIWLWQRNHTAILMSCFITGMQCLDFCKGRSGFILLQLFKMNITSGCFEYASMAFWILMSLTLVQMQQVNFEPLTTRICNPCLRIHNWSARKYFASISFYWTGLACN